MAPGREDRREVERGRQDADDAGGLVVQDQRGPDDGGVRREAPHPERMAEDHGLRAVPRGFLGAERAAHSRLHTQDLEEIVRHRHGAETLRLAVPAEDGIADAVEGKEAGNCGHRLGPLAQIHHVSRLSRLPREAAGVVVRDPDQALGIRERQGAQEQRVDHAEDGGARPDAQPGDEDGEYRETRIAPQGAKGIAEILDQAGDGHDGFDGLEVASVGS